MADNEGTHIWRFTEGDFFIRSDTIVIVNSPSFRSLLAFWLGGV